MSWFIAYSGTDGHGDFALPSRPLVEVSTPSLRLAVGGIPETCRCEHDAQSSSGWAVVGIGMRVISGQASIMDTDDWRRLSRQNPIDVTSLDGHFVFLRWCGASLECFTDQLGLRTLFFAPSGNSILLASRLDWIAKLAYKSTVDLQALGAAWNLFNQVQPNSCVIGVRRLGAASRLTIHNGSLTAESSRPWTPDFRAAGSGEAVDILRTIVRGALQQPGAPSLSLSGGIDSRLMLALLTESPSRNFSTHTWGQAVDPDVQIARRMAETLDLPHQHLDEPLPDVETSIRGIRSYVAQTNLVEPCISFLRLRYYQTLRQHGNFVIDGGFGEIARRQFFNRLVRLGAAALKSRDYSRLARLMRLPKADVFNAEASVSLHEGAIESLRLAMEAMPAVEDIGMENFADLFAVRTLLPCHLSPEQARLDAEIPNCMPMAQPSFLRAVLATPPERRANAGLHRDAIRKINPMLAQFPLTRSGFTHRFGLSTNLTWLFVKVKSRMMTGFVDSTPKLLFDRLREFVLDTVSSLNVRTYEAYDVKKIRDLVEQYYKGESRLLRPLSWWFTFELWRESLADHHS